jgi:cell wall-associated NlpC family hydrolase
MKKWVTFGAAAFVLSFVLVFIIGGGAKANADCGQGGASQQVKGVKLDTEQLANAQTIVATTTSLNLPAYAAVVALATAMQESTLHNDLVEHDHDSIGLFQQRVSIYGAAVAGDPVKSTTAFLNKLQKIPNWQTIPLAQAAQAVQVSKFPDAYAKWQSMAEELVTKLWTGAVVTGNCDGGSGVGNDGTDTIPAGFHLPTDAQQAAAVSYALNQLGKPYVWGAEGPNSFDCSGLVMAAWAHAGVALPRTTTYQVAAGVAVANTAAMQPGDLIFIPGSDGSVAHPGHVGMYIGTGSDGKQYLVQAPHTGDVVKISTVSSWQSEIVAIRRPVSKG